MIKQEKEKTFKNTLVQKGGNDLHTKQIISILKLIHDLLYMVKPVYLA